MSMSEILTALPQMQQLAEQLMTDRVRIERLTDRRREPAENHRHVPIRR